jgi:hypothetical protein
MPTNKKPVIIKNKATPGAPPHEIFIGYTLSKCEFVISETATALSTLINSNIDISFHIINSNHRHTLLIISYHGLVLASPEHNIDLRLACFSQ